jgi:hypothetical protein
LLVAAVAADDQLVTLRADRHPEERLDVLEVGVACSIERFDAGLRQDDSLHARPARLRLGNASRLRLASAVLALPRFAGRAVLTRGT